ncbi:hypothetical protein BC829DRAFT_399954 [Chytridium lagenaria]|nr:hypothetical protein BC829DRAFT_399954 [Chytridium lagenaria]
MSVPFFIGPVSLSFSTRLFVCYFFFKTRTKIIKKRVTPFFIHGCLFYTFLFISFCGRLPYALIFRLRWCFFAVPFFFSFVCL